jgi:predicted enzyme related to lactoylglutathione lyase
MSINVSTIVLYTPPRNRVQVCYRGNRDANPNVERDFVMARINFIELPASDLGSARTFYSAVFGWELTNYGPSYSCTTTGNVDLGLQGDISEAPTAPLPVVLVDDIDAAETAVVGAGGTISKPVFGFPGGRRFHFLDPNGLELAIMQTD